MATLALILARAGSKGLPGKNARMIAGKPMLAWTIEHAAATPGIDHVALTTDGKELAHIGQKQGIDVVLRPGELASDTATVDAAARHALATIEQRDSVRFDTIVILYGNVPVRPANLTANALAKLRKTGCDSVQSVAPVGKNHPYWMKSLLGENCDKLEAYQPNDVYRRQDLPEVFSLDGGVIVVTRESLMTVEPGKPHAFLGSDRRAVITEPGAVVDIDTEMDLRIAEITLMHQQAKAADTPTQPATGATPSWLRRAS